LGQGAFYKAMTNYLLDINNFQAKIINNLMPKLYGSLPATTIGTEGQVESDLDGNQTKVELWETFKALNDTWIAGFDFESKTLFEDVLLVDRASRNVGDKILVDIFQIMDLIDSGQYKNTLLDMVTTILVQNKEVGSIVTDQLSLCLLPENIMSYPKGGATWYDTANGLVFTSSGTQTPFTELGGSLTPGFSFNNSGFWSCSTNASLVNLGGDCTVILWVYGLQGGTRKTIFEKAGTVAASYQQELAVTWEVSSAFSYYSRRTPDYDYANMAATTANAWNMMALKMSTGLTTAARTGFRSKNGSAWQSSYTSRSNTALTPSGAIRIGTGYAGTCNSGGIGSVLCYNKMLSDAEIAQVYNAMKSTYGL
jgi:hypothetical protein